VANGENWVGRVVEELVVVGDWVLDIANWHLIEEGIWTGWNVGNEVELREKSLGINAVREAWDFSLILRRTSSYNMALGERVANGNNVWFHREVTIRVPGVVDELMVLIINARKQDSTLQTSSEIPQPRGVDIRIVLALQLNRSQQPW
jgi:hypothetical protein